MDLEVPVVASSSVQLYYLGKVCFFLSTADIAAIGSSEPRGQVSRSHREASGASLTTARRRWDR
jgi:hypothetical protein